VANSRHFRASLPIGVPAGIVQRVDDLAKQRQLSYADAPTMIAVLSASAAGVENGPDVLGHRRVPCVFDGHYPLSALDKTWGDFSQTQRMLGDAILPCGDTPVPSGYPDIVEIGS